MESWSTEASASHVWAGRWSRPGIAGVGQGEARTASWGDPGPRPGQGHVLGSQAWPGSLETGPESPSGRLFLAVHPSPMPQSQGLPKPQMFRTLTLCVCVCSIESLCGPGGGPGIAQIFVWFSGFIPVSRERLGVPAFAQGSLSWSAQPVGTCPVSGASGKGGGGGGFRSWRGIWSELWA